ncbi:MAG: hypothetical protein OQJ83_02410 [Altibacter sp.]|uniref:hypothetical protein n=1 Tax=Altibacter lentus TaxID=1223410 RepID=UPI0005592CA1|nr:hypothetical protein [Altibacter lentus]MCW8980214.1 hypothetical protein [Altibacter sp.]
MKNTVLFLLILMISTIAVAQEPLETSIDPSEISFAPKEVLSSAVFEFNFEEEAEITYHIFKDEIEVFSEAIQKGLNPLVKKVDLSALPSGAYIVKVKSSGVELKQFAITKQ